MTFMEKTLQLPASLTQLQSIFPRMTVSESTSFLIQGLFIFFYSYFTNPDTTTATGSTRRKCKSSYWMFLTIIPKVNLL